MISAVLIQRVLRHLAPRHQDVGNVGECRCNRCRQPTAPAEEYGGVNDRQVVEPLEQFVPEDQRGGRQIMQRGRDGDPGNYHCNARKCLPIFYLTQPLHPPSTDHSALRSSQQDNQNAFEERHALFYRGNLPGRILFGRARALVLGERVSLQAEHALFDSYHSVFSRSLVENELVCRMNA